MVQFISHLFDSSKKPVHINHFINGDETVFGDKPVGGRPAVLMGGEPHLWFPGIGLYQIGEWQHAGHRVEVILLNDPSCLFLNSLGKVRNGHPFLRHIVC